jgi:hypothetical protein
MKSPTLPGNGAAKAKRARKSPGRSIVVGGIDPAIYKWLNDQAHRNERDLAGQIRFYRARGCSAKYDAHSSTRRRIGS